MLYNLNSQQQNLLYQGYYKKGIANLDKNWQILALPTQDGSIALYNFPNRKPLSKLQFKKLISSQKKQ